MFFYTYRMCLYMTEQHAERWEKYYNLDCERKQKYLDVNVLWAESIKAQLGLVDEKVQEQILANNVEKIIDGLLGSCNTFEQNRIYLDFNNEIGN